MMSSSCCCSHREQFKLDVHCGLLINWKMSVSSIFLFAQICKAGFDDFIPNTNGHKHKRVFSFIRMQIKITNITAYLTGQLCVKHAGEKRVGAPDATEETVR